MLAGLAEIKENINLGHYENQWEFEKDLYALGNILPHDFHVNLPLPLMGVFSFSTLDGPLVSISSNGLEMPELYFKRTFADIYLDLITPLWETNLPQVISISKET